MLGRRLLWQGEEGAHLEEHWGCFPPWREGDGGGGRSLGEVVIPFEFDRLEHGREGEWTAGDNEG